MFKKKKDKPYDAYFDDLEEMERLKRLRCTCGHTLASHNKVVKYRSVPEVSYWHVLGCNVCKCKQFK